MILVFFVFVVITVVWGVLRWKRERERAEHIRSLAGRSGWRYQEEDRWDRPVRMVGFEPFGTGDARLCRHVLWADGTGGPFELFDYHYEVTRRDSKGGSSTTHYWFRVFHWTMPVASPGLTIRDEGLGHKLFDMLGGEDIDFESDEFSRKYWVKGEDRRFAYDVVHPGMIEHLLGSRGWVWQWKGQDLVVYRHGTIDPKQVTSEVAFVEGFRARLPRHIAQATRSSR